MSCSLGHLLDHRHAAVEVGVEDEHQGPVGERLDELGGGDFVRGSRTTAGNAAAAQYAASAAEVSPVEAQAMALIGLPLAIICLTTETRTVMPRSLNEPVWLLPHCFTQRSLRPSWRPRRSAQKRFVPPSYMEMTFSGSIVGQTHSILPQMALP